ncbi:MAG: YfhO family protein, partial [Patescibacteria group bacterium]
LTHLNVIFALAWFPWQLLIASKLSSINSGDLASSFAKATDGHSAAGDAPGAPRPTHRSAAEERRVGVQAKAGPAVATLALLLGIPFLAGQIQIPFLIALVSSAYFLWLSWHAKRGVIRPLSILVLGGALAFGLTSAQLLPTAELAWHSTRGRNNDFNIERANQYSWPLYHAPAVLFPRFFGNDDTYWGKKLQVEHGLFIGTLPLVLALQTFFAVRDPSLRFWKGLVLTSFLLSLGSLSPFRLVGIEPSLWIFSGPARWLLFTTFSLSILAAYGWDNLPTLKKGRWLPWVAGGVVTAVLLANLAISNIPDFVLSASTADPPTWRANEYYLAKFDSVLRSLQTSGVSLLSPYTALPLILLSAAPFLLTRRHGQQVLLAVTAVELVVIATTTNPTFAWQKILTPPDTLARIPEAVAQKQTRLYSLRDFEDTGALLTNPEGRSHFRLHEEPRQLLAPLIHAQFDLPGVVWPASLDLSEQSKVLHQLRETIGQRDFELAKSLNVGAILSPTLTNSTPRVELVTLSGVEGRASLILQDGTEIPANYHEISPSHIRINTSSEQPGTLIVRDTYYPGWQATIDGNPVTIERSGIFRALDIPSGNHSMEMQYSSTPLYVGMIITAAALVSCGALLYKRK